jgi:hypothetical protein
MVPSLGNTQLMDIEAFAFASELFLLEKDALRAEAG